MLKVFVAQKWIRYCFLVNEYHCIISFEVFTKLILINNN